MVHLGVALEVEQPVALPIDIAQLGDHITREGRFAAQRLDLEFQRRVLVPLGSPGKVVVAWPEAAQPAAFETRLHPGGDAHLRVPGGIAPRVNLEPARLLALPVARQGGQGRQTPVAEFGNHQRFIAAALAVSMRAVRPQGTAAELAGHVGEILHPLWDPGVVVVIVHVAADMDVRPPRRPAGGIVDRQARRVHGFHAVVQLTDPRPVAGAQRQAGAPIFVDDRPDDERGVVEIPLDHVCQRFFDPRFQLRRDLEGFSSRLALAILVRQEGISSHTSRPISSARSR